MAQVSGVLLAHYISSAMHGARIGLLAFLVRIPASLALLSFKSHMCPDMFTAGDSCDSGQSGSGGGQMGPSRLSWSRNSVHAPAHPSPPTDKSAASISVGETPLGERSHSLNMKKPLGSFTLSTPYRTASISGRSAVRHGLDEPSGSQRGSMQGSSSQSTGSQLGLNLK